MKRNSSSIPRNIKILVVRYMFVKKFTFAMVPDPKNPPIPPALVIAIGILAVSTSSIFIRYAQHDAPSLVIAAYRLTLATLILSPYALMKYGHELRKLEKRDVLLAITSGAFLAVHFATWISSLRYTSVVSSVVIVQTSPLWVALFAPIFLGETLNKKVVWGLALALAGGIAVSLGESCGLEGFRLVCGKTQTEFGGKVGLGNFLALAGAWGSAGYLIIGRNLRARLSLIAYIYLVYGIAAILLVGTMFAFGYSPSGYSGQTYVWLLLLAVVPQLLGHSSFNWALGYLPASFVSITLLGEPIGSAILAVILLNEVPSVVKLIGAGTILLGIYLSASPVGRKIPGKARQG